jgi:hypothetical protein
MPVPDHQRNEVIPINTAVSKPAPEVIRTPGCGSLDIDQLAAVLARLLDL